MGAAESMERHFQVCEEQASFAASDKFTDKEDGEAEVGASFN
jgi:hypothetical protein